MFATTLLIGSTLRPGQNRSRMQRANPRHLQVEYSLLHLQAEVSLTEVRSQLICRIMLYRVLRYIDVGGEFKNELHSEQES